MRLADDERARVPFALVGVVLLVASATAAATLATRDVTPTRTRGDRAVERATAGASVALTTAARTALEASARNPVVTPANSTYGRAIDPDKAFRDALALRIYARVEQALRGQQSTAGGATAALSLPRVQTTTDAERAIDAVRFERVNGSVVRVAIQGLRVELRRDGVVAARSRINLSTTVHSSALALHERVQRFERLLNRSALDGPGLDRRVTALLQGVVGARGLLQYGGLPIANVLANRHVELTTNRALLSLQRASFGRADRDGSTAYRRARARVGVQDVVAVAAKGATDRAAAVLGRRGVPKAATKTVRSAASSIAESSATSVPVGVNVTADRAFLAMVDGSGSRSLDGTLRDAFTTTVRRHVEATKLDTWTTRSGQRPAGWELRATDRERSVSLAGELTPESVLERGARLVESHAKRVVVIERTTRTYRNGSRERTVVTTDRAVYRVTVAVGYELTPPPRGQHSDRAESVLTSDAASVSPAIHDRIVACATAVLDGQSAVDRLARRAVEDDVVTTEQLVHPDIPDSVRARSYRATAALRRQARNVSENVSTGSLAAGGVPVDILRSRVDGLHDAAAAYESVTNRAVAAVQAVYLGRVDVRLQERHVDGTLADVGNALGDRGVESAPDGRAELETDSPVVAVDGAPAYLTLAEATPNLAPDLDSAYYPMRARNVNWFTVPHGDAAQAVLSEAMADPPQTVRLGRAAQALLAADSALSDRENETLRARTERLRTATRTGVESAMRSYRGLLAASNVSFGERERKAVTRAALARWSSVAARANAVTNGSAADAIVGEAARVGNLSAIQRDRLAARFRAEGPDVRKQDAVRVPADLVKSASNAARRVSRAVAENALSEVGAVAAERAAKRLGASSLGAVPAGLPLAPVPGFWYATANAWSVSLAGSWAEFRVRARGGSPLGDTNGTSYVRTAEPVTFDVNGDGRPDEIGHNERISFEVSTTVVVVVPAGPRGVGDVDGEVDERSPGW